MFDLWQCGNILLLPLSFQRPLATTVCMCNRTSFKHFVGVPYQMKFEALGHLLAKGAEDFLIHPIIRGEAQPTFPGSHAFADEIVYSLIEAHQFGVQHVASHHFQLGPDIGLIFNNISKP